MDSDQVREINIAAAAYFNKVAREGIRQFLNREFPTGIARAEWQMIVLSGFAEQIFNEYTQLSKQFRSAGSLSSVAFHARNLLELLVWVIHCLSSEDNLRIFYEDAARDGRQLLDTFQEWTGAWKSDFGNARIDDARKRLRKSAQDKGISTIDGGYQRVDKITQQYPKLASYFKMSNKLLSKCAHPSAITVVGVPDEAARLLKESFWGLGCFWFCASIRPIGIRLGLSLDDPLQSEGFDWREEIV